MKLKKISSGLQRWLRPDSNAAVEVETGYRNTDGKRTQIGIHQFLNFLEEQHDEEFHTWLKAKRDAQKAADEADESNGGTDDDE